jgi:hypothetical protein
MRRIDEHTMIPSSATEAKRFRTLVWIVSLATVGLMFDGYDLVVYGTVVSTFLRDPSQIGPVDPALAGALVGGPLIGGLLIASGLSIDTIFFVLAGLALAGVVLTLLVPASKKVVTQGLATVH